MVIVMDATLEEMRALVRLDTSEGEMMRMAIMIGVNALGLTMVTEVIRIGADGMVAGSRRKFRGFRVFVIMLAGIERGGALLRKTELVVRVRRMARGPDKVTLNVAIVEILIVGETSITTIVTDMMEES